MLLLFLRVSEFFLHICVAIVIVLITYVSVAQQDRAFAS